MRIESCQHVAVGTDDGCVRLFTAEAGQPGLQYSRSMPAVKGRVLSAAWHPSGRVLVTGTSVGTLHAWDVKSGQEILHVEAGELPLARCSLAWVDCALYITC